MGSELPVIYIIDDIPVFREILKGMLEQMGFNNFVEAADGQEALEKLKAQPASIILSDHMMSPMSGLQLLEEVKKDPQLKTVPFIMISAVGDKEIIEQARSKGLTEYIVKPVRYEQLQQLVVQALTA